MSAKARKTVKNKVRFRRYTFALSDAEKQRYNRLCEYEKIGFKQLVKKALREYYKNADLPDVPPEDENQLNLFDSVDLFGNPIRKRIR